MNNAELIEDLKNKQGLLNMSTGGYELKSLVSRSLAVITKQQKEIESLKCCGNCKHWADDDFSRCGINRTLDCKERLGVSDLKSYWIKNDQ